MVAGRADGALVALAIKLKERMDALLPPNQPSHLDRMGGEDGVTVANQFEANVAPDGETALIVSGSAALAWLAGDPRAQFDIGHWLPVATAQVSGVVIASAASSPQLAALRLAVEPGPAHALPVELGVHLLGQNVTSIITSLDPLRALHAGDADMALLLGRDSARQTIEAVSLQMTPLFSLGSLDATNQVVRDPAVARVPTLPELLAARQITVDPALVSAWRCLAAAARLDAALLLPWLTPANLVAWWRVMLQDVQIAKLSGDSDSVVWHTNPTDNFGVTAMIADTQTSLALHRWLATRAR